MPGSELSRLARQPEVAAPQRFGEVTERFTQCVDSDVLGIESMDVDQPVYRVQYKMKVPIMKLDPFKVVEDKVGKRGFYSRTRLATGGVAVSRSYTFIVDNRGFRSGLASLPFWGLRE